jgi:nucleotide-binding universal stress UspA family protein
MSRPAARPLASLFAALALVLPMAAGAADLRATPALPPAPEGEAVNSAAAASSYLRRYAVLQGIRATFQVIGEDAVLDELIAEVDRLGAVGPTEADLISLDGDLIAEGSYYLVSLRYLILGGGAAWPAGDERTFVNDSLTELSFLEDALIDTVAHRADPLPILERAQDILSLTEGFDETPGERDRFAGRNELVDAVIADYGPRTST